MSQINEVTNKSNLVAAGLVTSGLGASSVILNPVAVLAVAPANVTTAVADIELTMTSLGTLAGSALVLALGVVGISMAIGYGKKIMAKG